MDYLVMECVEGKTLAKRLEKGPLPLEQVLKYGAQVADALDKAHRAGIVHRDLKPGNIMLTPGGVKLLDFDLAKPTASASLATLTVTKMDSPVTQEGTIVGTFQYMSPEQVEGKELDGRSDIFSLGAVLYEAVTGRKAFEGKSQLSVASSILEKEPAPITNVKPLTPPGLGHAIHRCFAKEPEDRWQSARDLAVELRWIGEIGRHSEDVGPVPTRRKSLKAMTWLTCGAFAAAFLAVGLLLLRPKASDKAMYFSAPLKFAASSMAVSPNGRTVAVVGDDESGRANLLWLYDVGSPRAKSLVDTSGASFPFWSPDGNSLVFFAAGKLKRLNIADGTMQTLCDAPSGRGGSWSRDGVIIFTPTGQLDEGLYRIPASGGTPTRISSPDKSRGESSHRWPMFLPDGKHFLYLAFNVSQDKAKGPDAVFVGTLGSSEKKFVVNAVANAVYAAPGYLLYYRDNMLLAQHFDPNKFELTGEAAPVLSDIQYLPRIARAAFAVSNTGLLVAQNSSGVSLSRLVWFDRKGNELNAVGKADVYANLVLAPDGRALALDKTDSATGNADVWIYGFERGSTKRLTFDPAIDAMPVWSPDGKRLVFSSSRQYSFDLYLKNTDGAAEEKLVEHNEVDKFPSDWSHDGKHLVYLRGPDLWVLNFPDLKSAQFLKAPSALKSAQFAPDGKWVAYASNESGKWEIYVTSFPEARGKWQVSTGGGEQPRWRSDGKELFFLSSDGKMMAAAVSAGANFDAGAPIALFQTNPRELVATSEYAVYDVSKDGQRFLINTHVKNPETQPMSIILNWDAELKKK
jgi:Tol biopolymer transport system component